MKITKSLIKEKRRLTTVGKITGLKIIALRTQITTAKKRDEV